METKLNIAEILKDKPKGTKLYSPLFGNVYLLSVDVEAGIIRVKYHVENESIVIFYGDGRYYNYPESEPLLFPSKEMRDWSKFAWKKGDVLVSKGRRTLHVIFEGFNDDTYTTFKGKHYICDYLNREDYNDEKYYNDYHKEVNERTIEFEQDNVNKAQNYINIIEKKLGGKLNRETLEVEKAQPEFNNGDIAFADYGNRQDVFVVSDKTDLSEGYNSFISLDLRGTLSMGHRISFFKKDLCKLRLATEEEKQQLFDALAKKGKAWDAKKKQVVDLKPKIDELKPFDKVLVRDEKSDNWRVNLFSHMDKDGWYRCIYTSWHYCIPYEGNEHLLGTTKDVEG